MEGVSKEVIDRFANSCREAAAHGLMRCSSGNFSQRISGGRFLISASGSWMSRLSPEDVSLCRIDDASLLEGKRPSIEGGFHAGVLRVRSDVGAVLHFQSPYATALACQNRRDINYFVIPDVPFYIGNVAHLPYMTPGSQELAQGVIETMQEHNMVVLEGHGQVTAARDMERAIQNAAFFEFACRIIIASGGRAIPLPGEDVEQLLKAGKAADSGRI